MSDTARLEAAALRARAARERLSDTAQELQQRLAPANLLEEAVDGVRTGANELAQTTANVARRRPAVFAAVAGGVILLVLHRPVARLLRRRSRETE